MVLRFRRATSSDREEAHRLCLEVGYTVESAYAPGSMLAWSTFIATRDVTLAEARTSSSEDWRLVAMLVRPREGDRAAVTVVHRAMQGKGGPTYAPVQLKAIRHEITRRARAEVAPRPRIDFHPPEKRGTT